MPRNEKITINVYNCVKTLNQCGSATAEIAEYLKVNPETVRRILRSDDFDDYKAQLTAVRLAYEARKKVKTEPAPKPEPATQADVKKPTVMIPYAIEGLIREQNKLITDQNELLKLISKKLAWIVEQLAPNDIKED